MKFPGVSKKYTMSVEFPAGVNKKRSGWNLWVTKGFQGLSFTLSGNSRGKVKK